MLFFKKFSQFPILKLFITFSFSKYRKNERMIAKAKNDKTIKVSAVVKQGKSGIFAPINMEYGSHGNKCCHANNDVFLLS